MKVYFQFYAYEKRLSADIGGFRKLWELAFGLKNLGHTVRMFYPFSPRYRALKELPATRYPILDVPFLRPLSAYVFMFIFSLTKGLFERPQAVYFRSSPNMLYIILARLLRIKAVLEVNVVFKEFKNYGAGIAFKQKLALFSEKFNALHADTIIALTDGLKELLIENYGVSATKIHVVPSATDPDHFMPMDASQCKEKIGIPASKRVVGFAGILYRHQGLDSLIRGAKDVLREHPGTLFLIVGDGESYGEWKRLCEKSGVEKDFIFTGCVPYETMPVYFNAMDVVVSPFTADRGETSPFKVIDAFACGKCVIASDIPSIKKVSGNFGEALITFKAGDCGELGRKINDALSRAAWLAQAGANARKVVAESYSWKAVSNNISDLIIGTEG